MRLGSEWLNEASVLVMVFGLLDHLVRTDSLEMTVTKAACFVLVSWGFFSGAKTLKFMEKSITP